MFNNYKHFLCLQYFTVTCAASLIPLVAQELDYSRAVQESAELIQATMDDRVPLQQIAVYKWANGATQQQVGQMLLYVDQVGRPLASSKVTPRVAKIKGQLAIADLRVDHVIVSMSEHPLEFKFNEAVLWRSPPSAVTFVRLDGDPPPAETESRRLSQAKALARDFSAAIEEQGADFFSAGQQLRLLPTPIHRYGSQDFTQPGIIDGHLFTFVIEGGSPPILLLLEAVREQNRIWWQYGLSRRGVSSLTVNYKGEKAWEVSRISDSVPGQSLYRIRDPR